jgi:uncharacterized membrane protein YtjA (UPF0391 family)
MAGFTDLIGARLALAEGPILFRRSREFSCASRLEPSFPDRNCSGSRARVASLEAKFKREVRVMLGWVVTFLIVALVAGVLGFGGVAGASIEIAKIIFFIAVVLFVVSAVVGVARGRRI